MDRKGMALSQYLMNSRLCGDGDLAGVLIAIASAAKHISREVNRAGLVDILGFTGEHNVQGEAVRKLDLLAHDMLIDALRPCGHVCALASEEAEHPLFLAPHEPRGPYVVLFDPLDGSSNIDAGITIGTIFSIYRARNTDATMEDLLQSGSRQVAAGYALYGSSTLFVYTAGAGVHSCTLDAGTGEFRLTHENLRMPERGTIYSANEANYPRWCAGVQRYIDALKDPDGPSTYSARYVGSLVADFHRTLLYGGLFLYPADSRHAPNGKLRLLYEAAPLARIAEAAGGRASTGAQDVLAVEPIALHQRVPLFIGSSADVGAVEAAIWAEQLPVDRGR
jgi:fructose-1,6-bisphosphatase I